MTKFLITTQGRAGSTLLASVLDMHPDIRCYHELLLKGVPWMGTGEINRLNKPYAYLEHRNYKDGNTIGKHLEGYLDEVYSSYEGGAVGFKVSYMQLGSRPTAMRYLLDGSIKIVNLNRQNILRSIVSLDFAKHTKRWHRYSWTRVWPDVKLKLDVNTLEGRIRKFVKERKYFNDKMMGCQMLNLTYEELVEDMQGKFRDVSRFLGVGDADIQEPKVVKSLEGDWREHVKN